MPNYNPIITSYKSEVNTNITSKSAINSISPLDVGEGFTDLADLLLPIINGINEFNVLGGSTAPAPEIGALNDLYFEIGANLKIYKKASTGWVLKVDGVLGISIVDGNISVQLSMMGVTVTSSTGNWGIDNTIYGKVLPTEYTVPTADLNFDRIDGLFGNKSNAVVYASGTASSTPAEPTTPTDTVPIGYVYVPSQASGNGPYVIGGTAPIITTLQQVLNAGRVGDRMQITQSLEIPTTAPAMINSGNVWVGAGTTAGGGGGLELTTIGSSGAATLIDNVLNIPVYTGGGGGGGVTSVGVTSTDLSVSGSPITSSGSITLNINNGAVTFAKMQNLGPVSLVGNSTAGSATMERITIGSGLSLTSGVLSATGGGGGGGGTVTSVAAGNGMNFTTITGSGTVTMGTPSSITASSSNSASSGTHTHALDTASITSLNLSTRLRIPTTAPGSIAAGDIWVGTGTTAGVINKSKVISTSSVSSSSFSIGSAQAATYITATNATTITATINSGVALSSVFVEQGGSGGISFVAGSGVTITYYDGHTPVTAAQHSQVEIFYKTSSLVIITGSLT